MKTRLNHVRWLLVAASLVLIGLQQASAFYDPSTQRWVNRDPIEEIGGMNLYEFVRNAPAFLFDPTGLKTLTMSECLWACVQKQFLGLAIGGGAVGVGLPTIPKGGPRLPNTSTHTSPASKCLSKCLPQRIPRSWAPTLRNPRAYTPVLGRFIGRWIPFIGAAILIGDAAQIAACTAECQGMGVAEEECAADYVNER